MKVFDWQLTQSQKAGYGFASFSPESRTSLEMDGNLHLISFFESPYGVGSIRAHVHPGVGGVDHIIVLSNRPTLKNFTSMWHLSVNLMS